MLKCNVKTKSTKRQVLMQMQHLEHHLRRRRLTCSSPTQEGL
ncbi:unnamed protein product [Brassica oleracea var. botrytis]